MSAATITEKEKQEEEAYWDYLLRTDPPLTQEEHEKVVGSYFK